MTVKLIAFLLLISFSQLQADNQPIPLAPGYGSLGYKIPSAGSYKLPPFKTAADGEIVDVNGKPTTLYNVFGDDYVLLSFMYSSCNDVNGCPLSAFVYYQLRNAMDKNPALEKNLRLVSLSFDPEFDTPEVMSLYANNFKKNSTGKHKWQFATTESEDQLAPILEAYSQDIQRQLSTDSSQSDISHILRVFLIDPNKNIRNIYSVSFLHKDLIIADLNTLLIEEGKPTTYSTENTITKPKNFGPGDDKEGYETSQYQTNSRSVASRNGKAADLYTIATTAPLGLPDVEVPDGVTLSATTIKLGRKLFFDRRLSLNDTFSCAMCHIPEQGFASNELAKAVGIEGRSVRRNTPSLYNVAHAKLLFHDGREDNLSQQVWSPLLAKNEMGNPSIGYVINKLKSLREYDDLFESAFEGKSPTMQTIGDALTAYQFALVSGDSGFDRWYYGKNQTAVSAKAKQGFELFTGKARCVACHSVGNDHALFTDNKLHNTGLGYLSSKVNTETTMRVQLAPGTFVNVSKKIIESVGERQMADIGLYEITENPADRWKFKTPSLRNIALTAPYMHDGSLLTLREVVEFYNGGGIANELLDPLMNRLDLDEQEIEALVAFLESLTGSNVESLIADALAAPVGDTKADAAHWSR